MKKTPGRYKNELKKHRVLMGFQQKEVAKLLGLKSPSRISRWEKGLAMPSVDNLIKLSILYATLMNELYLERYMEIKQNYLQQQAKKERK